MKLLTQESLTEQTCNDFPEAVILTVSEFALLFVEQFFFLGKGHNTYRVRTHLDFAPL